MILALNDIKKITFGAVNVIEENGFFVFNRFTEKQKECYKKYRTISLYGKTNATAGVRLSIKSNTSYLKFNYCLSYGSSRDFAYFDIYINKELSYHFGKDKLDDNICSFECKMPIGENYIEVYFPWSTHAKICNFEIEDGASLIPVSRKKTMIAYGDSITQGYDSIYPSRAYICQLAKFFDTDLYNKAIGGDTFFPELLEAKDVFVPDIVTVSYGTNDWLICSHEEFVFNTKTFFELLYENYKSSKIYVITPIWKKAEEDGTVPTVNFNFAEHRAFIKHTALSYDNVTVIDGDDLVPHDSKYFADEKVLHPNAEGFKYYAENLIKAIKNEK